MIIYLIVGVFSLVILHLLHILYKWKERYMDVNKSKNSLLIDYFKLRDELNRAPRLYNNLQVKHMKLIDDYLEFRKSKRQVIVQTKYDREEP